jgi:predicted DNA-binding protein (MmcQ/YjbR family)
VKKRCRKMKRRQQAHNKILNGYHMSKINYFKILLLCKMMGQMMLDEC